MLLDGSQSVIWSWGTEEMGQETAETLDDFSNPIPGQPCERPGEAYIDDDGKSATKRTFHQGLRWSSNAFLL